MNSIWQVENDPIETKKHFAMGDACRECFTNRGLTGFCKKDAFFLWGDHVEVNHGEPMPPF